ncbi:hypothetical protein RF11_02493 [Thelohanellus kitauei]|uniref:Uncharacterized protein n=1 Tax=Thelohanellus kitauei TaxID=669202 RepID=A0A0C2IAK5_THEKT|nr:hypothetical protein RF11_02493 [Thelohanellus kitauei]
MIREECINKLYGICISDYAVRRRIANISADILDQMIQKLKSSTLLIFSIQLDESTEVKNGSQLLVPRFRRCPDATASFNVAFWIDALLWALTSVVQDSYCLNIHPNSLCPQAGILKCHWFALE